VEKLSWKKFFISTVIIIGLFSFNFYFYALYFLALINLYTAFIFLKKSVLFYKTPFYNKALVGVYVKFYGKVLEHNKLKTPIHTRNCESYRFKVTARWDVKAPKPSKGYVTEIKPLGKGNSEEPFLMSGNNKEVFIDSSIIPSNFARFNLKQEVIDQGMPLAGFPSAPKYTTYRYINNYVEAGDTFTVYGRLIEKDGKFIITNTNKGKMPLIVTKENKLPFGSFYYTNFIDTGISIIFVLLSLFTHFLWYMFMYTNVFVIGIIMILLSLGVLTVFKKIFGK